MRRETDAYGPRYHNTTTQRASSNYYPVSSAIVIEDVKLGQQMLIMNDRSEGGSAYNNGTIELMVNRRGNTSDELGNEEALNETYDYFGEVMGVRTNARYVLKFTKSRSEAFKSMRANYVQGQHPL